MTFFFTRHNRSLQMDREGTLFFFLGVHFLDTSLACIFFLAWTTALVVPVVVCGVVVEQL